MISTAFVLFAYYVVSLLLVVFPASDGFPADVLTAFTNIGGYTAIINTLVPLGTLSTIIGLIIAVELLIFAFNALRFIMGYVPVVGGKG